MIQYRLGDRYRHEQKQSLDGSGIPHASGGDGPWPSPSPQDKPNILFIVSDDTGYGDLGPYGGGEGRGMPTPNIDRWRTRA